MITVLIIVPIVKVTSTSIIMQVNILMMDLDVGFLQHPMKLIEGKRRKNFVLQEGKRRKIMFVVLGFTINEE